jgi:hypothetical protein
MVTLQNYGTKRKFQRSKNTTATTSTEHIQATYLDGWALRHRLAAAFLAKEKKKEKKKGGISDEKN